MTHAFRMSAGRMSAGAFLLAGLVAGGAACAQTAATPAPAAPPAAAAPASPATEASRREARALGDKLGWENQVRSIINTLRTAIVMNLAQLNGKPPQEIQPIVDDLLMPDFIGDSATLSNMIVEAWAAAFTAEELRNLRTFYNTPLGDKLLRTIPQLNVVINQAGQGWAQKHFQAVQQKYAEEFAKRGLKLATPSSSQ